MRLSRNSLSRCSRSVHTSPSVARPSWSEPGQGTKVYACMSGGVDSSVAARLLLERGYNVKPVFMRNWETLDEANGSGGCEWERDWSDVQRICRENLGGVEPELIDLSKEYWSEVFEPALQSWEQGLTPNPDVTCNQRIKFRTLPDRLLARDPTAWIATGHYARLLPAPHSPSEPALYRANYINKDQSHYLSTSPISALRKTLFPLGNFASKEDVRALASKWNMHTKDKRDSMGICFVGIRKGFSGFLDSYIQPSPGNIEDIDGKVLGRHNGLWRYTVGEGARLSGLPEKLFVGRKDVARNAVVVVPKSSPLLRCAQITTKDFAFVSPSHPPPQLESREGVACQAQARSIATNSLASCVVRRGSQGQLEIDLASPILGISPGQTVALYDGEWCLGGGTIASIKTLADVDEQGSLIMPSMPNAALA
ncbi:tRNA-5-taurinomethyluridine 2-sulfurtransferase [Sporobolomyces koalae]|uniref:tRNA-5-taurinomethyluridine 2-sulfurtransferase n=1 Tax=Sporobolomyces koalae TaxID=500713 RepID=UPI0031739F6A